VNVEEAMHPDDLFAAIRRRPFTPFRLHVSDGSSHDIGHPAMILVTRRSAILALPGDPTQVAERALTIAMVHVSRIDELEAGKLSNGPV
jgi:hypothetical protein